MTTPGTLPTDNIPGNTPKKISPKIISIIKISLFVIISLLVITLSVYFIYTKSKEQINNLNNIIDKYYNEKLELSKENKELRDKLQKNIIPQEITPSPRETTPHKEDLPQDTSPYEIISPNKEDLPQDTSPHKEDPPEIKLSSDEILLLNMN